MRAIKNNKTLARLRRKENERRGRYGLQIARGERMSEVLQVVEMGGVLWFATIEYITDYRKIHPKK